MSRKHFKMLIRSVGTTLIVASALLASCTHEHIADQGMIDKDKALVTFSLRVPATTRSMTLAEESIVKNIQILAFETETSERKLAYSAKSSTIPEGSASFQVNMRKGTWDLVVVANCPDILTSGLFNEGQSQATVMAALTKSVVPGTGWQTSTLKTTGIPMCSDIKVNTAIDEGTGITGINIYRAVARVNIAVTGEAATVGKEFRLSSVRVYNYQEKTKLLPKLVDTKAQFEAAAGSGVFGAGDGTNAGELVYLKGGYPISTDGTTDANPTSIGFGDLYCNNVIYLNPAPAGSIANKAANTCLVVGGTYYGDSHVTYYRVDFSNGGNYLDIIRNHRYQFNITRVGGSGESDEQAAFERGPVNMEVTVVPWDEGDIIDITSDGTYGLGVNQKIFTLYSDVVNSTTPGEDNELIIQTNFTNQWTISCGNDDPIDKWLSVSVDGSAGFTHTLAGSTSTSNILKKHVYLQLKENNGRGPRMGWVTITAGTLTQTVLVTQKSSAVHVLSVDPTTLEFGDAGEVKNISITSNTDWIIASSNSWLTFNRTTGTDNATIAVTAAGPNIGEPRSGTITIVTTSGDPIKIATITVNQTGQAPVLSASPTSLNLRGTASTGNIVSVFSNVTWTATTAYSWVAITSGSSGSGDGSIVFSLAANPERNSRNATITVTSPALPAQPVTITITQAENPGGSADILYFAADGKLQVGKWGAVVTQASIAFFKFGSVIGFTNNGDSWGANRVLFNTTTGVSYATYKDIPVYTAADFDLGLMNVSASNYHTGANVKAGKGDPCKLVGLTGTQIRGMSDAAIEAHNSEWRLPTDVENTQYAGLVGATANPYSNTTYPYYGTLTGGHQTTAGIASNPAGGWFPIGGGADASQTMGRFYNNAGGSFLPAAGLRIFTNGITSSIGSNGAYWSSVPSNRERGSNLSFDNTYVYANFGNDFTYGFNVRCVRK